ncbi:MAG: SGNH/GDSL hydrolase family protein [Pseudobdellovibrio sp.]
MRKLFLPAGIFLFLVSFISCSKYLDRATHDLYQRPEWITAKSFIPNGLSGAQEFFFERQALAHDRLNLGTWSGFNEVYLNTPPNWKNFSATIDLETDAYIWIFLLTNDRERLGLRLSRNPRFESGLYTLDQDKMMTLIQKINFQYTKAFPVKLNFEDKQLSFAVDDKPVFSRIIDPAEHRIAFRSSKRNAMISEVAVDDTYRENFEPKVQKINWEIGLALIAAVTLLVAAVSFFSKAPFLIIQAALMLFLVGFYQIDKNIISEKYIRAFYDGPYEGPLEALQSKIEKYRHLALAFIYYKLDVKQNLVVLLPRNYMNTFYIPENTDSAPPLIQRIYHRAGLQNSDQRSRNKFIDSNGELKFLTGYSELAELGQNTFRIAFMGSSQTYGAGALSQEQAFPSLIMQKAINLRRKKYSGFNFSSPGEDSGQMLERYREILKYWQPKVLIVNLANNDKDIKAYRENLEEILKLNKSKNILTVLIKEPNDLEIDQDALKNKYEVLDAVGQQYGAPVLDLNSYVNSAEVYDKGILWWDVVHFDQAGHHLVAEWLFKNLLQRMIFL